MRSSPKAAAKAAPTAAESVAMTQAATAAAAGGWEPIRRISTFAELASLPAAASRLLDRYGIPPSKRHDIGACDAVAPGFHRGVHRAQLFDWVQIVVSLE
jgi:hypothetical protein